MTMPEGVLERNSQAVMRIFRGLDRIEYELEKVKDIEEAVRLVRLTRKRMNRLIDQLPDET